MLKLRFAILLSLCLLTCGPGFKDSTDSGGNPGEGGTSSIGLDLVEGTNPGNQGTGLTNNIQITCTPSLSAGGTLKATTEETCTGGAGSSLVTCNYTIDPSVLSKDAALNGKTFNLTYQEKKLLPFSVDVVGRDFDLIQSWAAVIITYSDMTTQTFLSAETTQSMTKTIQTAARNFKLNQPISKVSNVTFTAFLGCTSLKHTNLSSTCANLPPKCDLVDRRLADSNRRLNLVGTFSWEISNLKLEITQ